MEGQRVASSTLLAPKDRTLVIGPGLPLPARSAITSFTNQPRRRSMNTMQIIDTGLGLKSLRAQAGLSQERLARAADVSTRTVFDVEAGLTVSPKTAARIADVLGVEPDALWVRVPDMYVPQRIDLHLLPDGRSVGRILVGNAIVTLVATPADKPRVTIARVEPVEEADR